MGREIEHFSGGRRHGDFLRAFRPKDVHAGRRVERIYDSGGRLRAERATAWRQTTAEMDPRLIGQMWPEAVGLFNGVAPVIVGFSLIAAGVNVGPWMVAAVAVIWALIIGLEGLIWCVLLACVYATITAISTAIWGEHGGWVGLGVGMLAMAVLTWRAAR